MYKFLSVENVTDPPNQNFFSGTSLLSPQKQLWKNIMVYSLAKIYL